MLRRGKADKLGTHSRGIRRIQAEPRLALQVGLGLRAIARFAREGARGPDRAHAPPAGFG